jgi:hypothetical protein
MNSPAILDEWEAAERLAVSVFTLRKWRAAARGPRFVKLPGAERRGRGRAGLVRYRPQDLDAFLAECLVPTENPMPPLAQRNRNGGAGR